MSEARMLFVGGGQVGYETLRRLAAMGLFPRAVAGMSDHPHEAFQAEPLLRELCREHGALYAGADLRADALAETIGAEEIDFLLTTGYRRIIPSRVYGMCARGALGSHFSLLPRYRGFAPINWAVLNGETETGVTLFHLVAEMDAGDVVAQEPVEIGPDETAGEVMERALGRYLGLLEAHLPAVLAGTAPRRPQDEAGATYTCARRPEDGRIDWSWPARRVHDLVRALSHPYPGAFTTHAGRRLLVWRTRLLDTPPRYVGIVPGRVVGVSGDSVRVLAGDGVIELLLVQPEGGEEVPAGRVIRSIRDTLGYPEG